MPMPGLKSLKGLARRRSSQASPDENSPPVSGFRVIPREEVARRSIASYDKPVPSLESRRTWSEEGSSFSNRVSGSTASTTNSRIYERSSSTFADSSRRDLTPHYPIARSQTENNLFRGSPLGPQHVKTKSRDFLDLPNGLEGGEEFGSMFTSSKADSSQPQSPAPAALASEKPLSTSPSASPARYSRYTKTPPPLHLRENGEPQASPYSWKTRTSQDGLLSSPLASPTRHSPPPPTPPPHMLPRKPLSAELTSSVNSSSTTEHEETDESGLSLRRSESTESFTRSGASVDADAKMVRNSVLARRHVRNESPQRSQAGDSHSSLLRPPNHSSIPSSSSASFKTPSLSSSASSLGQADVNISNLGSKPVISTGPAPLPSSNNTTPRAKSMQLVQDDEDEPLSSTLLSIAKNNPRLSVLVASSGSTKPVLAPQPVMPSPDPSRPSALDKFKDLSVERTASPEELDQVTPLVKERKNGKSTPSPQLHSTSRFSTETSEYTTRPTPNRASYSAPSLMHQALHPAPGAASQAGDDDDDDVPLAILQAHNFPNRGKTPDPRLSQNSYVGTPSRPMSTVNGAGPSNIRSLPPFARRLPEDPYGSPASVLNASRESLQLSRTSTMFPPGQSPVPGLPPGGLVGVIAEEERAKSFRRAAPAGQSNSLPSMGPAPMMPGMSMGMQGPVGIPGLAGLGGIPLNGGPMQMPMMAEQTQINNQLLQLVQQQNLMLQHMYAQMQQFGPPTTPFAEQQSIYASPHTPGSPSLRPGSVMGQGQRTRSMVNVPRPMNTPRSMSMVHTASPFANQWGMTSEPLMSSGASIRGRAPGYALSVAPSERSNVGQPSRYRPISVAPQANDAQSTISGLGVRISTASPPQLAPLNLGINDDAGRKKKSGFFSAMIHPKGKMADSTEEEEDWGSFARKRRNTMTKSSY